MKRHLLLLLIVCALTWANLFAQSTTAKFSVRELELLTTFDFEEGRGVPKAKGYSILLADEDFFSYAFRSENVRRFVSREGNMVTYMTSQKYEFEELVKALSVNKYNYYKTEGDYRFYKKEGYGVKVGASINSNNKIDYEIQMAFNEKTYIFLPQSYSDLEKVANFNKKEREVYLSNNNFKSVGVKAGADTFFRDEENEKLVLGFEADETNGKYIVYLFADSDEREEKIRNSLSSGGYVYNRTTQKDGEIFRKKNSSTEIGFKKVNKLYGLSITIYKN